MKCCKNCRWLKWVTTTDTFYYCSFDGGELSGDLSYCCNAWKPPAQTNGDRIRSMSDEELAEKITDEMHGNIWCEIACSEMDYVCDGACEQHVLEWLKENVRDGEA